MTLIERFCEEMFFCDGEDFFPDADFIKEKWGSHYSFVDNLTDQDSIDSVLIMWAEENEIFDREYLRSDHWEAFLFSDGSYLLLTDSWWSVDHLHQEDMKIGEIRKIFFERLFDI